MKYINMIDGVCGSGKTTNILSQINSIEGQMILAFPTKALANEVVARINKDNESRNYISHVDVELYHNDATERAVAKLTAALATSTSKVIVTTHASLTAVGMNALLNPQVQESLSRFTVFADEAPKGLFTADVPIRALKNAFFLEHFEQEDDGWMSMTDYSAVHSIYRDSALLTTAMKNLLWTALAGYKLKKTRVEESHTFKLSGLSHSPLLEIVRYCKKFHVMASNIKDSPFIVAAKEWCNIESVMSDKKLQPDVHRNAHYNTARIQCFSLFEGRASQTRMLEHEQAMYDSTNKAMGENEFLFATNERFNEMSELMLENGVRIPYISSGFNCFAGENVHGGNVGGNEFNLTAEQIKNGFTRVAFIGCARLSPEDKANIYSVEGSQKGERIVDATEISATCESAYQTIMRCKLRDQDDESPITVVFLDDYTMHYCINNYFPEAKIIESGMIKIKKTKTSKADKTREEVQYHKLMGFTQSQTAAAMSKGIATIKRHWN
ncbi:DEAD/DEAH box helicase [Scandinavium manionii]|uniref:DEAD/DEAH box helicase n=1 Tax=Scandinavium manionii TaxID=2926520 RepID=UPI0021658DF3|nr:DEAD/DEAH box helicase [Scandinavium manionii]MCS2147683.1 hypothetical protein [Scandinavium manionii]